MFSVICGGEKELPNKKSCLLWVFRVVVPTNLQDKLQEELHQDHPGISKMNVVARSYIGGRV